MKSLNYDGTAISWANRQIRTSHVCFGEILYEPGGSCGPRVQRDYEIIVLHSGSCQVTVDAIRRELALTAAYLFRPGHREHFRFSPGAATHHSWCAVQPGFMPVGLRRRLGKAPLSVPWGQVFHHLLAAALAARSPRRQTPQGLETDLLGLCVFAEFLRAADDLRDGHLQEGPVNKALLYMEEHLDETVCLAGAHRAAGVSRNALICKFRQALHATPSRHLWKLRTERGIAMLSETGLTVAEIAYRCGFKNPFHFSRLVKKHQGAGPRQVRRTAWAIDPLARR